MSQQQQGQFQRRQSIIFNDFRYPMPETRDPVDGAKYPARWNFELGLDGKIYSKVNDGIYGQQDKNSKSKEVELNWADRNALFNLIENAYDDPNFTKAQYHVKKKTFGSGGRMNDQPSTLATFTVMRSPEGKIMVGYSKGTYKVMFEFTSPNDSVIMISVDGQPQEAVGLMSRMYAKAFVNFARRTLDKLEIANYKPREPKEKSGGNGGGNGNWGNQRSGGNNGGGNGNWGGNGGGNNGGGNGGGNRQRPADDDFGDVDF